MPRERTEWMPGNEYDFLMSLARKILNNLDRSSLACQVADNISEVLMAKHGSPNESVEGLTAQDIIDKIRDFDKSKHSNISAEIFLHYLARFPQAICKRDISPLMRTIISANYHVGSQLTEDQKKRGLTAVSMEDLSEWFGRSKATISVYVHMDADYWQREIAQYKLEEEARAEAKKQLIEEEKEKLRKQHLNKSNTQTDAPKRTNVK